MTDHTTPALRPAYFDDEAPSPVVVGVDGSADAESAADWAAAEAAARHTRLIVVHALAPSDAPTAPADARDPVQRRGNEGRDLLERAVARLRERLPDLEIESELSDLSPAQALVMHSRAAALVVTGTRGHGGFTGMLLGSVSRKLAAHAACPLVVVHASRPLEPADTIVLGVGRKPSPAAARHAFEAARRTHAAVTVVRAWWPHAVYYGMGGPGSQFVGELDTARKDAMAAADEAVEELRGRFPDVPVHVTTAQGNAVPVLVDAARGARLLVVGGHRHRGPLSAGAGYVVEGVIAHSPTPVAVVPVR